MPEDVGPSALEVTNQDIRGFIDDIKWRNEQKSRRGENEQKGHPDGAALPVASMSSKW